MSRNVLSFPQRLKLLKWLEERPEHLAGRTDAAIAKEATIALNFKVVGSHVTAIRCDNEIPFTWECSRSTSVKVSPRDFQILVQAVGKLAHEYEVPLSEDFKSLLIEQTLVVTRLSDVKSRNA